MISINFSISFTQKISSVTYKEHPISIWQMYLRLFKIPYPKQELAEASLLLWMIDFKSGRWVKEVTGWFLLERNENKQN